MPESEHQVAHHLNCAKLVHRTGNGPANPCSCGTERSDGEPAPNVHNHGPNEGAGLNCKEYETKEGHLRGACLDVAEWEASSAAYRKKIGGPQWDRKVPHGYSVLEEDRPDPRPATVPPVNSGDLGATLTRWWVQKAQEEAEELVPKAVEYGGAHRASDLTQLGRTIAELMGYTGTGDFTEGQLQELACYFYIQGKLGRWQAALLEGRQVSDDTIHDVKIYTTMVQRIRSAGGWPV